MPKNALVDRLGGLLMLGFVGTTAEDIPADLIAESAGAILFTRNLANPVQARALTDALRAASRSVARARPLPLIGLDQEGGPVSRLEFGTRSPSAMALGAANDGALTTGVYHMIGDELAALGVNLDFAPVADFNDEPSNPVIGIRSFGGDDPQRVAKHVDAAVRGLHASGIGTTAKHFPGHGSARTDSHLELPAIDSDSTSIETRALVPFRAAIRTGADVIMIAHASFPALDSAGVPATVSRAIVTGLLRDALGFDGVICSDAMEMQGIASRYSLEDAAVAALHAGIDLLIYGETESARVALRGVRAAVARGTLDQVRLERSLERIDQLRARLSSTCVDFDLSVIGSQPHKTIAAQAARHAITVVRDPKSVIPLKLPASSRLFVVNFLSGAKSTARQSTAFGKALARGTARVTEQIREINPAGHEYKQLLMAAGSADAIVAVARNLEENQLQARAIADLELLQKPTIAIAARSPFDSALLPGDMTVMATYGDDDLMMEAAADIILGLEPAHGTLPVTLSQ